MGIRQRFLNLFESMDDKAPVTIILSGMERNGEERKSISIRSGACQGSSPSPSLLDGDWTVLEVLAIVIRH